MYFFPRCSAEIACDITGSDHVGERTFGSAEINSARYQKQRGDPHREIKARPVETAAAQNCPAKTINYADHWIDRIQKPPFWGDDRAAETHRGNVRPELNDEQNDVAK